MLLQCERAAATHRNTLYHTAPNCTTLHGKCTTLQHYLAITQALLQRKRAAVGKLPKKILVFGQIHTHME